MTQFLISRPGHVYLAVYDASPAATSDATSDAPAATFVLTHDLALPGCCPSWLGLDRARSLLYVVDEDSSQLHRFRLDPASAHQPFTHRQTADTASPGAVYTAFSRQWLLCAAFASGTVDVWDARTLQRRLDKTVVSDGRCGPLAHIQDAPHPHQVLLDPTARFFVVPDLGTDELLVIDSRDDAFTIASRVPVGPPGSGPRHGAFYPVGAATPSHYMLLCELANLVVVYALRYTDSTIEFTRVSETSTFGPAGPPPPTARAGHLELLPDNKHVYLTNRLTGRAHDSVAYLRIRNDGEHPVLEFVHEVSTLGLRPRMFCVMDSGRGDILVANEQSEFGIVVLARTPDGRIEETPKLRVHMSEFMDGVEMVEQPGNGPKFIMEL